MEQETVREYSYRIENAVIKIIVDGKKSNAPKHAECALHSHSYAEIFTCEKGTAFIKTEGGFLTFHEGQSVVIPVGYRHKIITGLDGKNYRSIGILCEKIGVNSKICEKMLNVIDTLNPYVIANDPTLSLAVINISNTDDAWIVFCEALSIVKGFCLSDTDSHITDHKKISGISKNIDRFLALERFIDERFATNFSYAEIADQVHISERQLIRLVKRYYNESLSVIVRRRRMEVAAKLLSDSNLSIEDIATDIGYKSKAAFYNVFFSFFGTTPASYRREHARQSSLADSIVE